MATSTGIAPSNSSSNSSSTTSSRQGRRSNPFDVLSSGGVSEHTPHSSPPASPLPSSSSSSINAAIDQIEAQYSAHGEKSLAGIALRSALLGLIFCGASTATLYVRLATSSPLWRVPFFACALSIFHFLEFWVTARYNPPSAAVSSFLFTSNGSAYQIAHVAATLECLLSALLFPSLRRVGPPYVQAALLALGFALVVLGQLVRSVAMYQAGTNFNHVVQHRKAASHRLVTSGLYQYLRHPSYFGFFWWSLGTQLVLGNAFCLLAYAAALWKFFSTRIRIEEKLLVSFFPEEYPRFRKATPVGIPFV